MALLSTVYCTEAELQRFMSTNASIDFADHDDDNAADTDVINDCINQATEEIDMWATERYAQAQLSSSNLVSRWCVVMAARFLCQRRMNSVPSSLEEEFQRLTDLKDGILPHIATGGLNIPGINVRDDKPVTWSNLIVDRRRNFSTIRRTSGNSSNAPSKLSRDNLSGSSYYD
jgi:phage gp36-like protein